MKAMFFTEKSKGLSVQVGGATHKLVGIKGIWWLWYQLS